MPAAGVVVLAALVVGAGSLVGRFRRARGTERQQLRWLAWGAALAAVALLVAMAALVLEDRRHPVGRGAGCLRGAAAAGHRGGDPALPAVRPGPHHQPHPGLRAAHRAAGLAATPAVVLGLGQLLGRRTPAWSWPARPWPWRRCSSRPAAASSRRSTGASTAAATTPPSTIAAFSARLREQVDLDTLTAELLAVVDQTMQPTQASLWLRPQRPPDRSARTADGRSPAVE